MTPLSEDDGKELVRIARTTLREYAACGALPPGAPHRKSLLQPSGAAVHLYVDGAPHGMAIFADARDPLYHTVELAAVQAGFFDPRHDRLTDALAKTALLVVTLLGEPEPVTADAIGERDVDLYAIMMRAGPCQAVMTPECARTGQLTREAVLDTASRNCGLSPGAWRDGKASLWRLPAQTFRSA